jgi:hypothetical protein
MRGFPQELVVALIFGAVLLGQFLYRQLRRKAAAMQVESESGTHIRAGPVPDGVDPLPMQAEAADASTPALPPRAEPTAVAVRASGLERPDPRRFSRRGLLPDRRAVQDAIVIAAVLRPCHAHSAHDAD